MGTVERSMMDRLNEARAPMLLGADEWLRLAVAADAGDPAARVVLDVLTAGGQVQLGLRGRTLAMARA